MSAEPAAWRGAVAAVFAIAAIAIAVAIAVLATKDAPVVVGTNGVGEAEFVAVIRDSRYCQRDEIVPTGTAAVRLLIGTYHRPGPRLHMTFRSQSDGRQLIADGRLAEGWTQGRVRVPTDRVDRIARATMCIRAFGGNRIAIAGQRTLDRRRQLVRVEYLSAGEASDLSRLSEIADNFGRGKSRWAGSWTLPLTGLLVLAGLVLAARRMIVEGRP